MPLNTVTGINTQFQQLRNNLLNYINTKNISYVNQYQAPLHNINTYIASLEIYLPKKYTDIYKGITQLKTNIEEDFTELSTSLQNISDDLNRQKELIPEYKEDLVLINEKIVEYKSELKAQSNLIKDYFETKETTFDESFKKFSENLNKEFDDYYRDKDMDAQKISDIYDGKLAKKMTAANKHIETLKKLVSYAEIAVISTKYENDANVEKKSYNSWRKTTLGAIILFASVAIVSATVGFNVSENEWINAVSKFSIFTSLGYLIGYASKVASGHRKQYLIQNQLSLEHSTLDPYLVDFSSTEKKKILENLVYKYFGNFGCGLDHDESISIPKGDVVLNGIKKMM